MPANRFFFEGPLSPTVSLSGAEFHHLKVMRVQIGEEFEVVDGKGSLANAKLLSLDKQTAHLSISTIQITQKKPSQLILAIPLMRPSKIEWILEKGTELGADVFYLYPAQQSEKLYFNDNQLQRLHQISISALKQSGRLFLPSIQILTSLRELFSVQGTFFYGDVRKTAPPLLTKIITQTTLFVSGPEKGFSIEETKLLEEKGVGVSLSPYILRAETAPLAAISILAQLNID